jgi:hypothetical protein
MCGMAWHTPAAVARSPSSDAALLDPAPGPDSDPDSMTIAIGSAWAASGVGVGVGLGPHMDLSVTRGWPRVSPAAPSPPRCTHTGMALKDLHGFKYDRLQVRRTFCRFARDWPWSLFSAASSTPGVVSLLRRGKKSIIFFVRQQPRVFGEMQPCPPARCSHAKAAHTLPGAVPP